jgi:hypothetical protein
MSRYSGDLIEGLRFAVAEIEADRLPPIEEQGAILDAADEIERLWRDCPPSKEERDRLELLAQVSIWHDMWGLAEEFPARDAQVRRAMLRAKRQIDRFWILEAHELPSRVLYRRVVLLDDMAIRMVKNALFKSGRDSLRDEAKASVKNHGGPREAHEARIIRSRYGIPRF